VIITRTNDRWLRLTARLVDNGDPSRSATAARGAPRAVMARRPTAGLYQDQAGAARRSAGGRRGWKSLLERLVGCPRFAAGAIDAFDRAKEYIDVKPVRHRYTSQNGGRRPLFQLLWLDRIPEIESARVRDGIRKLLTAFEHPDSAGDSADAAQSISHTHAGIWTSCARSADRRS
jgi:hypothetical protein